MASDDESKDTKGGLKTREEFPGWNRQMRMLALALGDTDGVFTDMGTNANFGYQLYAVGAQGNAKRREWNELARKLVGKVANKIKNTALLRVWTDAFVDSDVAPAAGQPDQRPYVFARCMAALEADCARASQSGALIARSTFILALKSFVDKGVNAKGISSDEKSGFVAYVDEIRKGEEKLRSYGVNMTEEEKKQLFYTHFSSKTGSWSTLLTVWQQTENLTFDQILQKGITEQQKLDLKTTENEASGVRAYGAFDYSDGYSGGYNDGPADYYGDYDSQDYYGGHVDYSGDDYYAGFARGGRGRKGKGGGRGKGGKGGGRGGGRDGYRGGKGNGVGSGGFDGVCWTCGRYGHKSEDCRSGGGKSGGKGGKGGKGKRKHDQIVIPGCMALLGKQSFSPLELLIAGTLMLLVVLTCVWSSARSSSRLLVPAFVTPLVLYGGSKVMNQYDPESERFAIRINSAISGRSHVSKDKAIFDTGAALHIINTSQHMKDICVNSSYSVLGVSGKNDTTACDYAGHVDMSFWAMRWDTGNYCKVNLQGESRSESNALLCAESPLNLMSWSELKKAGWLCFADLSGIYHPKYRLTIYFDEEDGVSYMPLVVDDDFECDDVTAGSISHVGAFLSSMTKYFVTFGGPDITRLRKTGEIVGLKLEGDAPPPIREFQMAKMRRSYPKPQKESISYKPFECVIWDMQGKFRTPSIGGCYYAHDAVERALNLRFSYPVTDPSAETFVEVLTQFITFVGEVPGEFVLKIARADMGSNYTSNHVRKFLERKGIRLQLAAVHSPHMIRRGELNHAIINSTMRAIMSLANAPRNTWALARKYSCVLNNFLGSKYNTPEVFVPWYQIPGMTLDIEALHPFGCLVIAHKAKEQVTDGYCDQRGVAGAFVGWSFLEGVKAIAVLLPGDKIEHTVFYKADCTYFPWRPDGQRRLLNDGTFGDEGETARVFTEVPEETNFGELLSAFDDDSVDTEATGESAVTDLTKGDEKKGTSKIDVPPDPDSGQLNTSCVFNCPESGSVGNISRSSSNSLVERFESRVADQTRRGGHAGVVADGARRRRGAQRARRRTRRFSRRRCGRLVSAAAAREAVRARSREGRARLLLLRPGQVVRHVHLPVEAPAGQGPGPAPRALGRRRPRPRQSQLREAL